MEELSFGTKILNTFLRLMVFVLVGILIAVVVCLILAAFGFF
ncbi:ABC-type transporter Mla subunit MlaD [Saonia flava]|uniref:ABC-type transporter Mla subunit MlaD n=1 Tax=Saonia flava TaxID=523696 RepID=A0A846QUX4_9FLAO|nr:ABC-type transporter Mla subunit MlaD [Saonia flava]